MSKRILIIDDEQYFRFGVSLALRRAGYITREASNSVETLRILRSSITRNMPFNAILLDLQLPDCFGLDLLSHIQAESGSLPVLIVSGSRNQDIVDRIEQEKQIAFLRKPFKPDDLIEQLNILLSRHAGDAPDQSTSTAASPDTPSPPLSENDPGVHSR